jgi:hypothetical protein
VGISEREELSVEEKRVGERREGSREREKMKRLREEFLSAALREGVTPDRSQRPKLGLSDTNADLVPTRVIRKC